MNRYPSQAKERRRIYAQQWRAAHPGYYAKLMKRRRLARPDYDKGVSKRARERAYHNLIRYKLERGCDTCGYREYSTALQFHHIEPVGQQRRRKVVSVCSAELEKCQLLCANCHMLVSHPPSLWKRGMKQN